MSETAFTPGAWLVAEEAKIKHPEGTLIAQAQYWPDAHLIATAPYLYSLLEGVGKFLENNVCLEQPSPDSPPEPASQFEYEAGLIVGEIQQLLAKARGES